MEERYKKELRNVILTIEEYRSKVKILNDRIISLEVRKRELEQKG